MKVNHNISALTTQNALNKVQSQADKSMKKLSTGLRINSAADDAAGMAISQKLKTQVRGLKVASRNSLDGVSLVQTAEGALNEVQSMLQRMRELSIQAANDTLQAEDRSAIQLEINQLITEIDDTSKKTEFNKIKLLNGDASRATASSNSSMVVCSYTSDTVEPGRITYDLMAAGTQASVTSKGADFNTDKDVVTGHLSTDYSGKLTINGEIVEIKREDDINTITNKLKQLCDRAGIDIVVTGGFSWEDWQEGKDGAELKFVTQEVGSKQSIDIASDNTTLLSALGFKNGVNTSDRGTDAVVGSVTYNGKKVLASCNGNEIEITADAGQVIRLNISTYVDDKTGTFRMATDVYGNFYNVDSETGKLEGRTYATDINGTTVYYTATGQVANQYDLATLIGNGNDYFKVTIGSDVKEFTLPSNASLDTLRYQLTLAGIDAEIVGNKLVINSSANDTVKVEYGVAASMSKTVSAGANVTDLLGANVTFDVSDKTTHDFKISFNYKGTDYVVPIAKGSNKTDIVSKLNNVTNPDSLFSATTPGNNLITFNNTTASDVVFKIVSENIPDSITRKAIIDKITDNAGKDIADTSSSVLLDLKASPATLTISGGTLDNSSYDVVQNPQPASNEMFLDLLDFGPLVLHVGPNENMLLQVQIPNVNADGLGISNINLRSRQGAEAAIPTIDEALKRVSDIRSRLGAYQNRLEYTISNLDATQENATASLSRVEDTDMAEAMSEYTQKNVLSQAGVSILAQANQRPQQILQLLQ